MSSFNPNELLNKSDSNTSSDIPTAVFLENVERFLGARDPLLVHASLKELLGKYNFMFESFLAQKRNTLRKLPDIQQSIEVVQFLKKRNEESDTIKTHFPLTDNLHAKAEIPPSDKICLWLGANVMLEYSIKEAENLLNTSNQNATKTIAKLDDDMAFLRDQITTTEVNIARVHNHMVKIKAQLRALESSQEPRIVTV